MPVNENTPIISVLMSVLNCEKTLDESLACLESQTETRWECIICDDGSTDKTAKILLNWQNRLPDKIKIISNTHNKGLSFSLNRCLDKASGEYIARMDGDDRCSPDRFEKELSYLQNHPEHDIVSTDMQCFDAEGVWGVSRYPTEPKGADLVHGTPFCHAGCMVRTKALQKAGGYSENEIYERVEDYELWVRMYALGSLGANIHEPLYQMRDDRNAASRRKWEYRINEARVRMLAIKKLQLPAWMSVYALRPLLLGVLPSGFQRLLHRKKLSRS